MMPTPLTSRLVRNLSLYYKGRRGLAVLAGRASADAKARSLFYRSIWEQAAAAVGCPVEILGSSLLEIKCGEKVLRVFENYTSLDDPVTLRIAGDKPLVHRLLEGRGLPTPRQVMCTFNDLSRARRFASDVARPLVVKPARGTGSGKGVTAGVSGRRGLARAMAVAGAFCEDVVIEEQIAGEDFRLLYLDGELIDAVHRRPPSLVGDGSSTVKKLISLDNQRRRGEGISSPQPLLAIDQQLKEMLRTQGYGLRSVLPAGTTVMLKRVVSDNRSEDNLPALGRLCPAIVESGAAAAIQVGAHLSGVDVITPDPSAPLERSGGVVLEVNTTPGLHFHYPTPPGAMPVAEALLRRFAGRMS